MDKRAVAIDVEEVVLRHANHAEIRVSRVVEMSHCYAHIVAIAMVVEEMILIRRSLFLEPF